MLNMYEQELLKVNRMINTDKPEELPRLFERIPLEVFGTLLLDVPAQYGFIKQVFPEMPSPKIQTDWTGSHGGVLLQQSLEFIKCMVGSYSLLAEKQISDAKVLDFGCGWGRLIRLLYKYVSISNIYGCDPWDKSIELCKTHGINVNLAISDYQPAKLPFDVIFDLIYAFSVFTHLSEKTTDIVQNTLRNYLADDGVLVITIRPQEYWNSFGDKKLAKQMIALHEKEGFAFVPHNREPINGDITYGDTSMSLQYIEKTFKHYRICNVEHSSKDPLQVIVILKPL